MGGGTYTKHGVGDDRRWLGGFNIGKLEGWKARDEGNDNIEVRQGVGPLKHIALILGGRIPRTHRHIHLYATSDLWYRPTNRQYDVGK